MAIPPKRRHPPLRGVVGLILAFPFLALCQPQNIAFTPGRADLSAMLSSSTTVSGSTTVFGDTVDINTPLSIENKLVAKWDHTLDDAPFFNPKPVSLVGKLYGNITVIAEQVRLNQAVRLDLSGQAIGEWRDGGDVLIVAHKLVVDNDGQLRIDARGADGYVGDLSACSDKDKPADLAYLCSQRIYWSTNDSGLIACRYMGRGKAGSLTLLVDDIQLTSARIASLAAQLTSKSMTPLETKVDAQVSPNDRERLLDQFGNYYDDPRLKSELTQLITSKATYDRTLLDALAAAKRYSLVSILSRDPYSTFTHYLLTTDLKDGLPAQTVEYSRPVCVEAGAAKLAAPVVTTVTVGVGDSEKLKRLVSRWTVKYYEYLDQLVEGADLANRRSELVDLFRKVESGPQYPIVDEDSLSYRQAVSRLNDLRHTLSLPLRVRAVTAQPFSAPIPTLLFNEGSSLETRLAPTNLVVKVVEYEGKPTIGVTHFSQGSSNEVVIAFTLQLAVDPAVAAWVKNEIAGKGERYAGLFTSWDLKASMHPVLGLISADFQVSGEEIGCTMKLDTNTAAVFLSLLTGTGVPVVLDWTYRSDQNVKGTFALPLTLAARNGPPIVVDGKSVINSSPLRVDVYYFKVGDQFQSSPFPALSLGPHSAASLPSEIESANVTILPTAVAYGLGSGAKVLDDFAAVSNGSLVEYVTVENLLPTSYSVPNGTLILDYLEVFLDYTVMGQNPRTIRSGPIRLSPSGTAGAKRIAPFFRVGDLERTIKISGRAYFRDGSSQALKEKLTDVPVNIGDDMLALPQQ